MESRRVPRHRRYAELSPTRERKRSRRLPAIAVAVLATLTITATACGTSAPSEGALEGKTATAITSLSITAFHRQRSVTFVTKTIIGKSTTIESGAASATAATETVTSNGHPTIQAVLVDGVAYLRASASVLAHAFSLSSATATSYAGKWISFHSGDSYYQEVVNTLSKTQAIVPFVPQEPNLRVAGVTSVAGKNAVAIAGSPAASYPAGSTATSTLFVSTSAPFLPLSSTIVVKGSGGKTTEQVAAVYGKWNHRVDPAAPTGATPIASVSGQ